MNIEQARANMIKQQIKTWNVNDARVIQALESTHREAFVPEGLTEFAFSDMALPLPHGQHMLTPKVEAKMLQLLELQPDHHVLEIGTGSGYFTALLAKLAKHVVSVDMYDDMMLDAAESLFRQGINNITLETGDAALGWDRHTPYDAVVITASMPVLPETFKKLIHPQGRIIAILGDAPNMTVCNIARDHHGHWQETQYFETIVAPLQNAVQPERFVF